jgi:uncharacterized protein YbaR (Trm112 family)
MADKDANNRFEVVCPFCRGTLTVDREKGVILHAVPPSGPRREFEEVLGEIRSAEGKREEQFSRAFLAERERRASLDKKFEVAQEKAAKDPKKKPFNPMDVD